ncbi:Bifunctional protein PutA (Includes: Proline dehydrogenase; Delta-1-pyrroline-5-carboxylate dehydrogenase) [Candidatus Terasakiella magnetica]|uniref:Bifunctional protein PutA n=1 Tax=Candidatus Terasakiella magnetica TaxID=1867952 RepID=A0A1C3RJS8_9PROT|nr:bifunctional proline dehydrogenase/L-glutamate gamma-semialdehyde dehydrogenase PutA [Candidatus Terasakiella magnetica]SCA57483.1 Bifunctional protein PutA (Includes: Proline dehydrogenase; Delta-1-pyrroline-5-carboxylate dehydrogenase) [Candidatus Terasakiella magnetica]
MFAIEQIRKAIRKTHLKSDEAVLASMAESSTLSVQERLSIQERAITLIEDIRKDDSPALLENFLAEYSLSTDEGVALMCLAEALMRVPDATTIDELIENKIAPSAWSQHLGHSQSLLVNASTWGLMLSGSLLDDRYSHGLGSILHGIVKRLGEPVIRSAIKHAMKELGSQFVLGETIEDAIKRGDELAKLGYNFSYDMLGEAALTRADATKFFNAYKAAIETLAKTSTQGSVAKNPGISIKLSALHPRYEVTQKERVMKELVERTLSLTLLAKDANMGLNIDAEEADRLDLSLDVIQAVLSDERLKGWDGFGVVVQAYNKRSNLVIDWLYEAAEKYDRKLMVRLVKGAYWDSEIKRAQLQGLSDFPVFTQKPATDCSYIYCAEKLLGMTDRLYPQFATHNANSVAMVLELANKETPFEFQRLHGMGEVLHRLTLERDNVKCRIYAPVGPHRDLLAYLVRRLLENGANSSFVNQIVDHSVPAGDIAQDPIIAAQADLAKPLKIAKPQELFGKKRLNSKGWDLHNEDDLLDIENARQAFKTHHWSGGPLMIAKATGTENVSVKNPADPSDSVGTLTYANAEDVETALKNARAWQDCDQAERSRILRKAADLFEENFGEFFALLTREAGKVTADAIGELREAVDFLHYYADQAEALEESTPRGIFTCISPWNFPLAIFTGQISAGLSVGNGVLAKPAQTTSLCATVAVKLLHEAGVPKDVLQLLPGEGRVVGARLAAHANIDGVCFTGSMLTAQSINKSMAQDAPVSAPLIAETGGINAMIVDSTALPEQAIKDVIISAFQSAGQRCSALRILYVQKDIAAAFIEMLYGTMDELNLGDPWIFSTDIGPVIDRTAQDKINRYVQAAKSEGKLLKQLYCPTIGSFVAPAVIQVGGIGDMAEEIFGPILHVATFKACELDQIVDDINASGFGLTFGLHTRIDERVEKITSNLNVGNMYVNRNQIGAIVGSQPFGGEGLSGTGPKAGGPHYVKRFTIDENTTTHKVTATDALALNVVQKAIDEFASATPHKLSSKVMPGPTGESNVLSTYARGLILCLGPTIEDAMLQAQIAKENGCATLIIVPEAKGPRCLSGFLTRTDLAKLNGFGAVAVWSEESDQRAIRKALAERDGAILPLINQKNMAERCQLERHLCIDTTAAGGNAALLAMTS